MFIPAIEKYYLSLSFQDLRKDFDRRKPMLPEVDTEDFCILSWNNGNQSSNDILIDYLTKLKVPYIRTFDGAIWFLYDNEWTGTKVKCENHKLYFKRCVYVL